MKPYAALQSTNFYLPSYGESATSGRNTFALNYASKEVTGTRCKFGAKFDKALLLPGSQTGPASPATPNQPQWEFTNLPEENP